MRNLESGIWNVECGMWNEDPAHQDGSCFAKVRSQLPDTHASNSKFHIPYSRFQIPNSRFQIPDSKKSGNAPSSAGVVPAVRSRGAESLLRPDPRVRPPFQGLSMEVGGEIKALDRDHSVHLVDGHGPGMGAGAAGGRVGQ